MPYTSANVYHYSHMRSVVLIIDRNRTRRRDPIKSDPIHLLPRWRISVFRCFVSDFFVIVHAKTILNTYATLTYHLLGVELTVN